MCDFVYVLVCRHALQVGFDTQNVESSDYNHTEDTEDTLHKDKYEPTKVIMFWLWDAWT